MTSSRSDKWARFAPNCVRFSPNCVIAETTVSEASADQPAQFCTTNADLLAACDCPSSTVGSVFTVGEASPESGESSTAVSNEALSQEEIWVSVYSVR